MKKINVFYVIGLLIGFLLMVSWQIPDDKTRIIVCEVGQGEAILITKGVTQVLIDGGPSSEKVLACLSRHLPFWERTIELIVLTNTDFDHMNGLSAVVERYSLGEFVTADGVLESQALSRFVRILGTYDVSVEPVEQGDLIMVGRDDTLQFQVLSPSAVEEEYIAVFSDQIDETQRSQILGASAKRGEVNERSVVLLLTEGSYRALLTGDAGDQAEKAMLEAGILMDIDYLKVGHHGSKYASSLEFLQKIQPELAVISVGEKNRYGHPTEEALTRLGQVGARVMRTDEMGEVVVEVGKR